MGNTSKTTLVLKRQFNVAPEILFDAWTNPEQMKRWFFTMEHTNKVAKNEPVKGGTWEIVDHREGKDYQALGSYIDIDAPKKLIFTFKMPQFNDEEDLLSVEILPIVSGCEMTFSQEITVPHEEEWTKDDIEKAHEKHKSETEQGWYFMFEGLKQLVETGKINYPF